ncbi:hypothetical protein ACHAPT_012021 [Fusarium lateritium]
MRSRLWSGWYLKMCVVSEDETSVAEIRVLPKDEDSIVEVSLVAKEILVVQAWVLSDVATEIIVETADDSAVVDAEEDGEEDAEADVYFDSVEVVRVTSLNREDFETVRTG